MYTTSNTYQENEKFFLEGYRENPKSPIKKMANAYSFGFNGQEKVNEIAGVGNHNTALFWEYDTRLGRRWNIDPVDQISISNYATLGNSPIIMSDLLGDQAKKPKKEEGRDGQQDGSGSYEKVDGKWKKIKQDKSSIGGIDVIKTEEAIGLGGNVDYGRGSKDANAYMDHVLYPMTRNMLNWTLWLRGSENILSSAGGSIVNIVSNGVKATFKKSGMNSTQAIEAANSLKAPHAMSHLLDGGVIGGKKGSTMAQRGWLILNHQILTNPLVTFKYTLRGNTPTTAYLGIVKDKLIVLFVTINTKGRVRAGQTIAGWEIGPNSYINNPVLMKAIYKALKL